MSSWVRLGGWVGGMGGRYAGRAGGWKGAVGGWKGGRYAGWVGRFAGWVRHRNPGGLRCLPGMSP